MIDSPLTAQIIDFNSQTTIPLSEIEQKLFSGGIIVIPQCLQHIGYDRAVRQASLEGIEQAVGESKASEIAARGFEALHEVIDLEELPHVSDRTYQTIRALSPELSKALVREVFQQKKPFYCEEYPNVRFHVPYDVVVKQKDEFGKFYWNGKVTAHGPHHDSWYQCPVNCINVWVAIGSVQFGNGLNIYPQAYGKRLPCTKEGKILGDRYCGAKISFNLQPGDALIFHGEHLHSSEINSTDATRYVVSWRMTLNKPKFLEDSPYKYNYIYSQPQNTVVSKFKESIAGISRRLAKKLDSLLTKPEARNYILADLTGTTFDNTAQDFPQTIPTQKEDDCLTFDATELKVGEIKPISKTKCAARLSSDRIVTFSRYCPHEGADLGGAELKDGKVLCPWHNLPFNLQDGASPCQSLPALEIVECQQDEEHFKVPI